MKRITIFAGHYGSGKTNVAVNYALSLADSGLRVSLSDLDIVNPYFRSKDSEKILSDAGIRFISSEYANSNVDVPALPPEAYAVTADKESFAVVDVGGDDRGALALGRYVPSIIEENNYEMLFVVNKFRPLTKDAAGALEVMREIEYAAKLNFTGIVNNSNIGDETTVQDILSSVSYAEEISRITGLPVKMTSVHYSLEKELLGKIPDIFPIKLYIRQTWKDK
ncbi:MAG: hypothetical protein IKV97_04810 [Clostridia bacterium]|nr:hypothetical protein [Clostridia bacterium]